LDRTDLINGFLTQILS